MYRPPAIDNNDFEPKLKTWLLTNLSAAELRYTAGVVGERVGVGVGEASVHLPIFESLFFLYNYTVTKIHRKKTQATNFIY